MPKQRRSSFSDPTGIYVSKLLEAETKVFHEGKTPLVFGFQAVRIYYDKGSYAAFEPVSEVTMKDAENSVGERTEKTISEDVFVAFDELIDPL